MSQDNIELVKGFMRLLGGGIWRRCCEEFRRRLRWCSRRRCRGAGTFRGTEGLQQFFAGLMKHLNNTALPIERYLDAGDHVVAIGRTQGTVVKTGRAFDVPLAHVWQIERGLAVRFRPYIDHPAMMAALGE